MISTAALLAALALSQSAPQAEPVPAPSGPLRIHGLSSIDIAEDDLSDLDPVLEDIGDARIVVLGEPSHGEGSIFLAKSRLVRALHERLGFDVLAFESGMGVVAVAEDERRAGRPAGQALARAIQPLWGEAEQMTPLFDYLDRAGAGDRPLALAGFDMQESGANVEALAAGLKTIAEGEGGDAAADRLAALLTVWSESGLRTLLDQDLTTVEADLATLTEGLADPSAERDGAWAQTLESVGTFFAFVQGLRRPSPEVLNLRDQQMADNLAWLATSGDPRRKIIVWAATSHGLRDRAAIDPANDEAREMKPMGAWASERFGDDYYLLAFTGGEGRIGSWVRRDEIDIGTAATGSVEEAFMRSGHDVAFAAPEPEPERRLSWMLGYRPMPAHWDRAVDGVFFVRTVTPTTYAAPASE